MTANPLLEPWSTPFEAPPFSAISAEHFGPAFEKAIAEHAAEIAAIAQDPRAPDFANTIDALERAGEALGRVNGVFWNLTAADTNDSLQEIERNIAPVLARHHQAIMLDAALFARIDALFGNRDELGLNDEQRRVLELTHKDFVRSGATLDPVGRARLSAIMERLAVLGTTFSQNVLADEKSFLLVLEGEQDLAGLPASLRDAAAQAAAERGLAGKHAITLGRSLIEPFLKYSSRRDLREKAFKAWLTRGENPGPHDNRPIVAETIALRAERAALLGYPSFADYKLDDTMARTPAAARDLLERVWQAALVKAAEEEGELRAEVAQEGGNFDLGPHDWRYYAEKVRKARYDLDEAEIKPYFVLPDIISAAFDTASRLFGITFTERHDVPVYHPDVRAFEVRDRDGRHLALFFGDYYARPSKRSGAWNSGFRRQSKLDRDTRPIVVNVMNFAKAGEGEPTLLGLDEARTLFHEFGHALHSILTDVTYPSIAGTSVARDFVEFPSQLYEHWLMRPEVLERFARHAVSREPMPKGLLDKIEAARNFNQGFAALEYCSSALVDLDFHALSPAAARTVDPIAFEREVLERIGLPRPIVMRHRTPHFAHVFSGDGYSAGYYSYLWSEMLDADGFGAFEEAGIFDQAVAERLRKHVLAAGDRHPPEQAYVAFRGRMPKVETLLEKRGLA